MPKWYTGQPLVSGTRQEVGKNKKKKQKKGKKYMVKRKIEFTQYDHNVYPLWLAKLGLIQMAVEYGQIDQA